MNNPESIKTETGGAPNSPGLIFRISVVIVGLLVTAILSIGTDALMKATGVYSNPMTNPMFGIATAYRLVYAVLGCYVTARIAPSSPMKYAIILGVVGLVLSIAGLMAAISAEGASSGEGAGAVMGPMWYPIALVVTAIPCAWVGGKLRLMQLEKR